MSFPHVPLESACVPLVEHVPQFENHSFNPFTVQCTDNQTFPVCYLFIIYEYKFETFIVCMTLDDVITVTENINI